MSAEEIDRIVAEARQIFPKVRVTGGVSADDISELEMLVGKIPGTYRHFLENYGTLGFYGLEIYGLVGGNLRGEGPPNAYFMTKAERDDDSLPPGHIIIATTGYGPVYLLNCETGEALGWNYTGEPDDELPRFASFESFLDDAVSNSLADYKAENGA